MDPKKHAKIIEDTITDIELGVFDNVKSLENRVADLVAQGVDPVQLRPQITQAFNEFASSVGNTTNTLTNISSETGVGSVEDERAVQALQQQASRDLSETVNAGVEDVMSTIVLAGAAGAGTAVLVNSARGRISGIMMETDDAVVRREQRKITRLLKKKGANAAEIASAKRAIKDRLTGINVTASVRDLTNTKVQDTVMKFDGAYTAGKAKREGIKRWRYTGGVIAETREWCAEHTGNTYTEDEINDLWTSGWTGKESGDPFVVRGGYNCRHFWVPVEDDE